MNLKFIEVNEKKDEWINAIYKILKVNGEHLYEEKDLKHWKTPYPKELIISDIESKKVYIVKDLEEQKYVHTFQLDLIKKNNINIANINKFATLPDFSGKGIGSKSIKFIENYCINKEISKILLDVYDQSVDAINFYKSKDFNEIGDKKTRFFRVLIMEKKITKKSC